MIEPKPLLLQAGFTLETLAHLQHIEHALLPQAEHLRAVYDYLKRQSDLRPPDYDGEELIQMKALRECLK